MRVAVRKERESSERGRKEGEVVREGGRREREERERGGEKGREREREEEG